MNTQVVDPLDDVIIEIEGHPTDGPNALPKNPDGTPNISHRETADAAQQARAEAERIAAEGFARERQQLQGRLDAERRAREQLERDSAERLEAERQRANSAEQKRGESDDIALRAHWTSLQTRKEAWEAGVATMTAQIESVQSAIAKASEAGDHAAVGKLSREMAEYTNAKGTYDQSLRRLAGEISRAEAAFEQAGQRAEPEPAVKPDKKTEQKPFNVDDWIDGCPENTKPWLRDNRDKLKDPAYLARVDTFARMYVLDNNGDSNALATAEFTEALREKFDGKKPKKEETMATEDETPEDNTETKPVRKATHAAPVSRSSPGSPAANGAIRLTQEQYNVAPQLYPSYEEFDADTKAKFPQWSETAARFQYDRHLKRARADGKFR
jgi:chromosome segregation ATPase